MVGCGSIGQAMLPLLRRHLKLPEDGLTVLEASEQGRALAAANQREVRPLPPEALDLPARAAPPPEGGRPAAEPVGRRLEPRSRRVVRRARRAVRRYVDRALAGRVRQPDADDARAHELPHARGHAEARPAPEAGLADRGRRPRRESRASSRTSSSRALLDLASGLQSQRRDAVRPAGWATLARDLGVTLIQISERDTQATDRPKRPERVREHLVDRRLHRRADAALRALARHVGAGEAARLALAPAALRLGLPAPAGRRDLRAQLAALLGRLPGPADDARRGVLDRRLPDAAPVRRRSTTARR